VKNPIRVLNISKEDSKVFSSAKLKAKIGFGINFSNFFEIPILPCFFSTKSLFTFI